MIAEELKEILSNVNQNLEIRLPDPSNNEIIGICVGQDEYGNVVGFIDIGWLK